MNHEPKEASRAVDNAQSARALASSGTNEVPNSFRVIITQESSLALDDVTSRANDGFEAGRVSRPQVLSWLIRRFADTAGEDEIQELRAAHFDKIAYFETLLKRAKETGVLPPELNGALQTPCVSTHTTKKARKALPKGTINDDITNDSTYR